MLMIIILPCLLCRFSSASLPPVVRKTIFKILFVFVLEMKINVPHIK